MGLPVIDPGVTFKVRRQTDLETDVLRMRRFYFIRHGSCKKIKGVHVLPSCMLGICSSFSLCYKTQLGFESYLINDN